MDTIKRNYALDVLPLLRGTVKITYSLAERGAKQLRQLLKTHSHMVGLGALTGNQALQQAKAQVPFMYVSGWQMAADANSAQKMLPDLSLYPVDSGPKLVRAINQTLLAAERISVLNGAPQDLVKPIVIDAEAGFGGILNVFELTKDLIEAGVAGLHLEDQLPSAKRCGHLAGKVVVSTREMIQKLNAARLAADICEVPLVIIGRTDSYGAKWIATDIDPIDSLYITRKRSADGYFALKPGIDHAISRAKAMAPYADLIWCETGKPDLGEAKEFASALKADFPEKKLVYNCSPSFNWQKFFTPTQLATFHEELAALGYVLHLITLAGFHTNNYGMYALSHSVMKRGVAGYVDVQQAELNAESLGYSAHRHQQEVGGYYYDKIIECIVGNDQSSVMKGSTEESQF